MIKTFKYKLILLGFFILWGCGGKTTTQVPADEALAVNEVMSSNDGASIDETGQTEDWIELVNLSNQPIALNDYALADDSGKFVSLPTLSLAPNAVIQLWASDDATRGVHHLPFKLSASGDQIQLKNKQGNIYYTLTIPPLADNETFARFPTNTGAFKICRYATPFLVNPKTCGPQTANPIDNTLVFAPFDVNTWPSIIPKGLVINELALKPAQFVEFKNFSTSTLTLSNYQLILAASPPDQKWPAYNSAGKINLPTITLAPGAVYEFKIQAEQVAALNQQAYFEGIALLYANNTKTLVDSVPFMHWPQNKSLTRQPQRPFRFRFCENPTPGQEQTCQETPSRAIGNRTRGLYTPGDFSALAEGSGLQGMQSVKFVMDLMTGNNHFLSSRTWPLHYTFTREVIDQDPALNRCNAQENFLFNEGWYNFSVDNYFNATTRRYHLGTLTQHTNAQLSNVEFTFGDAITGPLMRDAFYTITQFVENPLQWSLRPQDQQQIQEVRKIEATLPIVGPNAPFQNIQLQALSAGVAFGTLTYVDTNALKDTTLGNRTIVITEDVPNDIDFVAGLITEAFQTPLAHVNILSQSRKTPNLALPNARLKDDIKPLIGKLVRFEVNENGYQLRAANIDEAQVFWAQQQPNTQILVPRLDIQTNGLIDLSTADLTDLPSIGAKASQMAEMLNVDQTRSVCPNGAHFSIPEKPFAIPMMYYWQHMRTSGAQTLLEQLFKEDQFFNDINYRKLSLQSVQQLITQTPVDKPLLQTVMQAVQTRFGTTINVRFRSSSNTEDLAEFNGAGLYESLSAKYDDKGKDIAKAITTVWGSLWNLRAFEEREMARVDQTKVAMAVLVHPAFQNERANGVAVARNPKDITRTDQYYFNIQAGEASVTNPAPGVATEQLVYQWPPRTPRLTYESFSSLLPGQRILTENENMALACAMETIQTHFKEKLDPNNQNRWFSMESEFKFIGPERQLLIKQARPFKIIGPDIPNDCREIE